MEHLRPLGFFMRFVHISSDGILIASSVQRAGRRCVCFTLCLIMQTISVTRRLRSMDGVSRDLFELFAEFQPFPIQAVEVISEMCERAVHKRIYLTA